MESEVREKLELYYKENLVKSYIYASDIYGLLKEKLPISLSEFLDLLNTEVNINYEFDYFRYKDADNIFTMLNKFLLDAIDRKDVETVEKCNSMIRELLVSQDGENYDNYVNDLFYRTACSTKLSRRQLEKGKIDISNFTDFYNSAAITAKYLLKEEEDKDDTYFLFKNEFFLHVIKDLIDNIPEVVCDTDSFIKLYTILLANYKLGFILFINYPDFYIENIKVAKKLKKTYLKSGSK